MNPVPGPARILSMSSSPTPVTSKRPSDPAVAGVAPKVVAITIADMAAVTALRIFLALVLIASGPVVACGGHKINRDIARGVMIRRCAGARASDVGDDKIGRQTGLRERLLCDVAADNYALATPEKGAQFAELAVAGTAAYLQDFIENVMLD